MKNCLEKKSHKAANGGQSFSLGHLAPFVQVSREKITKEVLAERDELNLNYSDEQVKQIAERRLKDEINRGIQTIQYQLITLMTCNGQAPFVTMFMSRPVCCSGGSCRCCSSS